MRHGIAGRQLGRSRAHYHALMANLATSLLKHGSIQTTLPKAKEMRPMVEKLITMGKQGTLHARRQAFRTIRDEEVLKKLFSEIAPRMKDRTGGYLRIVKMGFRHGDAAPIAIIELVDHVPTPKKSKASKIEESEVAGEEVAG